MFCSYSFCMTQTLIHMQHIDLKSITLVPFGTLPAQINYELSVRHTQYSV